MTRADVFTEETMTRPLFEELTGEHAREDEWSGPHGFALGGMMQANAASLAEEYFAAANELVDAIKDKRIADYRIVESLGATEGAPASGAADLIVDITTTGETLRANGLRILDDGVILKSEANLLASNVAAWTPETRALCDSIGERLARAPRS